jgi:hypothetical protein
MKYGKAQDDFVKHIRALIDANPQHFFDDKDWRNLTIKGGRHVGLTNRKLEAASFYVKPVAAWVPHLLIPGHVPSCPKCEHARSVDTNKSKWIANPKILITVVMMTPAVVAILILKRDNPRRYYSQC